MKLVLFQRKKDCANRMFLPLFSKCNFYLLHVHSQVCSRCTAISISNFVQVSNRLLSSILNQQKRIYRIILHSKHNGTIFIHEYITHFLSLSTTNRHFLWKNSRKALAAIRSSTAIVLFLNLNFMFLSCNYRHFTWKILTSKKWLEYNFSKQHK